MGGIGAIPSRFESGQALTRGLGGLFNEHNFFARRKKNRARKAAKPQRQSAAAESHIERTTISLRLCVLPAAVGLCESK